MDRARSEIWRRTTPRRVVPGRRKPGGVMPCSPVTASWSMAPGVFRCMSVLLGFLLESSVSTPRAAPGNQVIDRELSGTNQSKREPGRAIHHDELDAPRDEEPVGQVEGQDRAEHIDRDGESSQACQ